MSKDTQKIAPIDDDVKKALADCRAPDHGPSAFVVLTYSGPNVLTVKGAGAGSLNEAMALFDDSEVCYALIRKDLKVEMANTVKFAMVGWIPSALKPMRRALVSTHKGQIIEILKPFQVDAEITEKSELTEEQLQQKINANAGIASSVCEKPAEKHVEAKSAEPAAAVHAKPAPMPPQMKKNEPAVQQKVMAGAGSVAIEDEAAFTDIMKQVRSDKADVNWIVVKFEDHKVVILGSGTGGAAEMVDKLDDNVPCFGFVRVTELIDGKSKTTKFAYVRCVPVNTKPMVKGELNTKRGSLDKLFQPWHVDLNIENKGEVSEAIVMDRITFASGSKSHIVQH